jgi:hypothetical protein
LIERLDWLARPAHPHPTQQRALTVVASMVLALALAPNASSTPSAAPAPNAPFDASASSRASAPRALVLEGASPDDPGCLAFRYVVLAHLAATHEVPAAPKPFPVPESLP